MPVFSHSLENTLLSALQTATTYRHSYITLEHLLFSLLKDDEATPALKKYGLSLPDLSNTLATHLKETLTRSSFELQDQPQPTAAFQRTLHRAIIFAQNKAQDNVTGLNVLLVLLREKESFSTQLLLNAANQLSQTPSLSRFLFQRADKEGLYPWGDNQRELNTNAPTPPLSSKKKIENSLTPDAFNPLPTFQNLKIPQLNTLTELANWLLIPDAELAWFADIGGVAAKSSKAGSRHYYSKWIPKRSGVPRLLEVPKSDLKQMQRQILSNILNKVPVHDCAHGFVKKRSCITSAQRHTSEPTVIAMDLSHYFPSIATAQISAMFTSLGYPKVVASHLAGLCTTRTPRETFSSLPLKKRHSLGEQKLYLKAHLPQGAPTSPALANLCTWPLDVRLAALAKRLELNYTRYGDDLAFSGGANFTTYKNDFPTQIAKICRSEGFFIHHQKTRIMGQGNSQRLTGLVVNRHVNIGSKEYDTLKATLYNCTKHGLTSQNKAHHPHFKRYLEGKVSWVESINLDKGKKLRTLFDKINFSLT